MMPYFITCFLSLSIFCASAQELDADLMKIRKKLDAIEQFTADLTLNLDVSFIRMPEKKASMRYRKGKETVFSSKDFLLLPKRGFDFSLDELFRYPFLTVDRGMKSVGGQELKVVNVIPTDDRSKFALATLYLDLKNSRVAVSEINTKTEGSYTLWLYYKEAGRVLPDEVKAEFAIEKLKIPLNFMGKDTKLDRKEMRNEETKRGTIFIKLSNYSIN